MKRALLLLAATIPLAACSSPQPLALGPRPSGPPAPALALAPLTISYKATANRPRHRAGEVVSSFVTLVCTACEEDLDRQDMSAKLPACPECGKGEYRARFQRPFRPLLDTGQVAREAARLLARRGGFTSVHRLRTKPGCPAEETRQAARRRGARLLLAVDLEEVEVKLVETTWLHPIKIFLFVSSSILVFPFVDPPNWFLAGERYGITVRGRWELRDLKRNRTAVEGRIDHTVSDTFAPFGLGLGPSRSFYLAGFLRVPNCLNEEDWTEIADQLAPHAQGDLARTLVNVAESARGKVE